MDALNQFRTQEREAEVQKHVAERTHARSAAEWRRRRSGAARSLLRRALVFATVERASEPPVAPERSIAKSGGECADTCVEAGAAVHG